MMWHDVIWEEMTCQLDTWHDADLTWIIGNGHGARIRGGDRLNLSQRLRELQIYLPAISHGPGLGLNF